MSNQQDSIDLKNLQKPLIKKSSTIKDTLGIKSSNR